MCAGGGGQDGVEWRGWKWDNCNSIINKYLKKKKSYNALNDSNVWGGRISLCFSHLPQGIFSSSPEYDRDASTIKHSRASFVNGQHPCSGSIKHLAVAMQKNTELPLFSQCRPCSYQVPLTGIRCCVADAAFWHFPRTYRFKAKYNLSEQQLHLRCLGPTIYITKLMTVWKEMTRPIQCRELKLVTTAAYVYETFHVRAAKHYTHWNQWEKTAIFSL